MRKLALLLLLVTCTASGKDVLVPEDLKACKKEVAEFHRQELMFIKRSQQECIEQAHERASEDVADCELCARNQATRLESDLKSCDEHYTAWYETSSSMSNAAWYLKGNDSCQLTDYPCFGLSIFNECSLEDQAADQCESAAWLADSWRAYASGERGAQAAQESGLELDAFEVADENVTACLSKIWVDRVDEAALISSKDANRTIYSGNANLSDDSNITIGDVYACRETFASLKRQESTFLYLAEPDDGGKPLKERSEAMSDREWTLADANAVIGPLNACDLTNESLGCTSMYNAIDNSSRVGAWTSHPAYEPMQPDGGTRDKLSYPASHALDGFIKIKFNLLKCLVPLAKTNLALRAAGHKMIRQGKFGVKAQGQSLFADPDNIPVVVPDTAAPETKRVVKGLLDRYSEVRNFNYNGNVTADVVYDCSVNTFGAVVTMTNPSDKLWMSVTVTYTYQAYTDKSSHYGEMTDNSMWAYGLAPGSTQSWTLPMTACGDNPDAYPRLSTTNFRVNYNADVRFSYVGVAGWRGEDRPRPFRIP